MSAHPMKLQRFIDQARELPLVRVAVVNAAQLVVLKSVRNAVRIGLVEPRLVGDPDTILGLCRDLDWTINPEWILSASSGAEAAAKAVAMVRRGEADILMKGNLHTDVLLHAMLNKQTGLRLPGRRVSHVFVVDVPGHQRLIGITDAAINITPDLVAKSEICQNAIDLFHTLGIAEPHVAVLSAVETVASRITSTRDAAALTLMARRGQIRGARIDGPLAFDNAISAHAAAEKGIRSEVAGQVDILLMPDLVSGNILAKSLNYLGQAVTAGIAVGLSAPVVLTSRADHASARMASMAIATLMHHHNLPIAVRQIASKARIAPTPTPKAEQICCPPKSGAIGEVVE